MTDENSRSSVSRRRLAVAGTSIIVGAAAVFWLTNLGPADISEVRPIEVSANGYVSSDSYRSCHVAQYDTWHASYY